MPSIEERNTQGSTLDFAMLTQMVGVQKALNALVSRRVPLDKEVVLGVLEAQQEIYSSEGMFEKKGLVLRDIITSLEQGSVGVEAVLQAAGIDATKAGPATGGFIRRLWDSIRRK
jgi:hypothetical protein